MNLDDPRLLRRLFQQVHANLDRLHWEGNAIKVQLVHKATNAEAEGVVGHPGTLEKIIALSGAGHRDFVQILDEGGHVCFREDAILDATGREIRNSAGCAFDVTMPAFRSVMFSGEARTYHLLASLVDRAAKLLVHHPNRPMASELAGWRFNNPSDLWWSTLFEIAWARTHPLLEASKRIWLPPETGDLSSSFIAYDLEGLRSFATFGDFGRKLPKNWLKRLPEAWVSDLEDVVSASRDLIDLLLESLGEDDAIPRDNEIKAGSEGTSVKLQRRFKVALSFSGRHRRVVEEVATMLANALRPERVLYDRFHEVEFAVRDLDIRLPQLYANESDLVVVFVSGEYGDSDWCGLEWRSIRDLLKRVDEVERVMFLRLDDNDLPGLLSIDGYINVKERTCREIADLIIQRYSFCG